MKYKIYSDGAARGNPGPAGAGAVALAGEKLLFELSKYLGENTNNFAEYSALVLALEKLLELEPNVKELEVLADSMLLVKQMSGEWKVKHPNISPLYERAQELCKKVDKVKFTHIAREKNSKADALANKAIDDYNKKR